MEPQATTSKTPSSTISNLLIQDYTSLSTSRVIPLAGGTLLDGPAEGVLRVLITNHYGKQHLAWIASSSVPGIGRKIVSEKSVARKGIVSIFWMSQHTAWNRAALPSHLSGENDNLNSCRLDLSADGYAGKELALIW